MRSKFYSLLAVASLIILTGCTNAQGQRVMFWNAKDMPRYYAGQNKHNLLKPATVPEQQWNYIGNDQAAPALEEDNSVEVNPDTVPEYADMQPVDTTGLDVQKVDVTMDAYGELVNQIFFAHGSARVSPGDKVAIQQIANGLKTSGSVSPALTLVGHASARVDGVMDPLRRRMINIEMAQKRAVSIATAFKKAGIAPTWIETISKGDEQAVAGASVAQEAKERRVDIFVKKDQAAQ